MKRMFTVWFAASFATLIMSSVAPALCSPFENEVADSAEQFEKLEERVRALEAIVQTLQNAKVDATGKGAVESQPRREVSDADNSASVTTHESCQSKQSICFRYNP